MLPFGVWCQTDVVSAAAEKTLGRSSDYLRAWRFPIPGALPVEATQGRALAHPTGPATRTPSRPQHKRQVVSESLFPTRLIFAQEFHGSRARQQTRLRALFDQ